MKFLRIFLQGVGALAIVGGAAIAIVLFRSFSGSSKVTDRDDAVFVLNWAEMKPAQNWSLIDANKSARNMTGDHADHYCIQLEDAAVDPSPHESWRFGPEPDEKLSEALDLAIQLAASEGAGCIPSFELANSNQTMIRFWSVTLHDRRPTAAQVLLLHPASKRLFLISFKT